MKHSAKITFLLVALFFVSQVIGLYTVSKYIDVETTIDETTQIVLTTVSYDDTFIGEPIQVKNKAWSPVYLIFGVLIGTALLFLLIRFKAGSVWKYWFFLSVFITTGIFFSVYTSKWIAAGIALALSVWKVAKPNVIVHNLTEVFIYTGIAIIFLSIFNLAAAFVLLILISIYDMIAVWKSKHMVTLAKFQTQSKVFAGLMIPYKADRQQPEKKHQAKEKQEISSESRRTAILGGGDIAFPLLFSAVVLVDLVQFHHIPKIVAFGITSIISVISAGALFFLLYYAKKDKFYPAMPFLSGGCFLGYAVVWILFLH